METRIVIFAKAPVPGSAKTRLIPRLGDEGAARLAKRMLDDTVSHALGAGLGIPELCTTPPPGDASWAGHLPVGVRHAEQGPGDLGQRLEAAAKRVIDGGEQVLLIGADCPELDSERLAEAAAQLDHHDAVICPAHDGGYVLLGLARTDPSLFVGETMRDIDEPADLDLAGVLS